MYPLAYREFMAGDTAHIDRVTGRSIASAEARAGRGGAGRAQFGQQCTNKGTSSSVRFVLRFSMDRWMSHTRSCSFSSSPTAYTPNKPVSE